MEIRILLAPSLLRERDEKGFIVAGSLLLLTITLVILTFIFFYQGASQTNLRLKSTCKEYSFQHQKKMRSILSKLLKMNPRAVSLRRQFVAAKQRLQKAMLTGTPPVIAAAEAHLIYIESARLVHDGKQKLLLSEAKSSALAFKSRLNQQIRRELRSRVRIQIIQTGLAVEADATDIAPQYYTPSNFIRKQRVGAIWSAPFLIYLPNANFFKRQSIVKLPLQNRWENSCAASLEERKPKQFFVTMTAAK